MPWQDGKRSRSGEPIRNAQVDRQVLIAMRSAKIAATPENRERVHEAIAGRKLSNKEIAELVAAIFADSPEK